MVLLELMRRQHAGIDGGVGGRDGGGGVAGAVHGGEAAPQAAAAARVVRRPSAPHPSSVFCKQEIMVEISVIGTRSLFTESSKVANPCHFGMDPDPRIHASDKWIRIRILNPDPAMFVIDLHDDNKKLIFQKVFLLISF